MVREPHTYHLHVELLIPEAHTIYMLNPWFMRHIPSTRWTLCHEASTIYMLNSWFVIHIPSTCWTLVSWGTYYLHVELFVREAHAIYMLNSCFVRHVLSRCWILSLLGTYLLQVELMVDLLVCGELIPFRGGTPDSWGTFCLQVALFIHEALRHIPSTGWTVCSRDTQGTYHLQVKLFVQEALMQLPF